jgi:hypothetical protein
MQPNELLIRQNFIVAKSGCYNRSRWFRCIPTFLAPLLGTYKIDLYHWVCQATSCLSHGGTCSSWVITPRTGPMIWVTYQTRGLLVTPRNSVKPSVAPDTVSKLVTQTIAPCCYKKIIHLPWCAIVRLIKIRPKTNPIPIAMLSMAYLDTHPITRSTRNNMDG